MVAESLAAISGVVSQIQAIKNAVSAAIEARDAAIFSEKAIELNAQIIAAQQLALSAQEAQAALVERERALKEEIAALEAWNAEKERYTLYEIKDRRFTYALKEEMQSSKPKHHFCVTCYQNKRISLLQWESRSPPRASVLACHYCGSDIYLLGERHPEHARNAARRG